MTPRPSVPSVAVLFAAIATAPLASQALAAPDYQFHWATITHPGNPAYPGEPSDGVFEEHLIGRGSVSYEYRISKWEIRTSDWVEFVNTFSSQADFPTMLFGTTSFTVTPANFWGGTLDLSYNGPGRRYRVSGSLGSADRPVFGISWREAALYCNWLNGGKSSSAATLWAGAYDTSSWGQSGIRYTDDLHHEPGALFWIPTLDEWFKAVYWDPASGQRNGWWTQPHGSDAAPVAGLPGQPGAETSHGLTDLGLVSISLGAYPESRTPWELLDSASGASEWVEEPFVIDGLIDERGTAGAAAGELGPLGTRITSGSADPNFGSLSVGFRLASAIPPPSTFLGMLALGGHTFLRRKRGGWHGFDTLNTLARATGVGSATPVRWAYEGNEPSVRRSRLSRADRGSVVFVMALLPPASSSAAGREIV